MTKDSVRKYIDDEVKKEIDSLSKANKIIEMYLEGYIQSYKYENADIEKLVSLVVEEENEEEEEVRKSIEERKNLSKEFKQQSEEILKNNIYSLGETDIKNVIQFYKKAIIIDEECTETILRVEALEKLEEKLNLK